MRTFIFLFALGLSTSAHVAYAASAETAAPKKSINVFSQPIDMMGMKIQIGGEDLASPLVEAHGLEQMHYTGLYIDYYNGRPPGLRGPVGHVDLPSSVDHDGYLLWFDGPQGETDLIRLVQSLFGSERFEDLERLVSDWKDPRERLADGRPKIWIYERALALYFDTVGDRTALYHAIQAWRRKSPKSAIAALAEVLYWRAYAWDARGSGYVDSVTNEGWKLFGERLGKADTILRESEPYASSNPLWGQLFLATGLDLGWPQEKMLREFTRLSQRYEGYEPIYWVMVRSLLPSYGGDWLQVNLFIRGMLKASKASDDYASYAALYWRAYTVQRPANLFQDSFADWQEMKQGFEELARRYPHSAFTLNNFAAAACMADDKQTFEALRVRIGKYLTQDSWPSNYSPDLCEHKFAS
jgi:hypothetical protein